MMRRWPTISPSVAAGSNPATMESWYELITQIERASEVCRSRAMAGSAVFAMAVSRLAMQTPSNNPSAAAQRWLAGMPAPKG